MNQLAHFVHQLVNGDEKGHINLSKSEKIVVRKLRSILKRDPDELAVQLSMPQVQAEEWLVPPPAPSIN